MVAFADDVGEQRSGTCGRARIEYDDEEEDGEGQGHGRERRRRYFPAEVRVHDVVHRVEEEADTGRQGHLSDQALHGRFGELARHHRLSIARTVEEADHLSSSRLQSQRDCVSCEGG